MQEKSHVVVGGRLHELLTVYKKGQIFHFHRIYKSGGGEGSPGAEPPLDPPLMICTLIWL